LNDASGEGERGPGRGQSPNSHFQTAKNEKSSWGQKGGAVGWKREDREILLGNLPSAKLKKIVARVNRSSDRVPEGGEGKVDLRRVRNP